MFDFIKKLFRRRKHEGIPLSRMDIVQDASVPVSFRIIYMQSNDKGFKRKVEELYDLDKERGIYGG